MKNLYFLIVLFLITQAASCQLKDSLYVGWGTTIEGPNISKMFLSRYGPYYNNRNSIISYYKIKIKQPINDGVVIVPIKGEGNKTLYSIFCRIWAWEYVTTVASVPVVKFDPMGTVTLESKKNTEEFQRIILVTSPGIITWNKVSKEPLRL